MLAPIWSKEHRIQGQEAGILLPVLSPAQCSLVRVFRFCEPQFLSKAKRPQSPSLLKHYVDFIPSLSPEAAWLFPQDGNSGRVSVLVRGGAKVPAAANAGAH